jgi:hypothetical protein
MGMNRRRRVDGSMVILVEKELEVKIKRRGDTHTYMIKHTEGLTTFPEGFYKIGWRQTDAHCHFVFLAKVGACSYI